MRAKAQVLAGKGAGERIGIKLGNPKGLSFLILLFLGICGVHNFSEVHYVTWHHTCEFSSVLARGLALPPPGREGAGPLSPSTSRLMLSRPFSSTRTRFLTETVDVFLGNDRNTFPHKRNGPS